MKSKQEFDNFYNAELKKLIDQLEARRQAVADKHSFKKYRRNLKWMAIVCAALMIASASAPNVIPMQVIFCLPATVLYAIIAPIVIAVRRSKAFKPIGLEYKQTVIPKMIAFIDPNLTYRPAGGISNDEFNASNLFIKPSRFKSEDLVMGKIDGLDINLSDIYCTATQSSKNSGSSQITVFHGLYAISKMPRNFPSPLTIQPESKIANAIGNFARGLIGNELVDKLSEKLTLGDIELGNTEFDEMFTVRSSNQPMAKSILTPTFVQLITAFAKEIKAPVRLSFFDNQMHVAISGIDLFEINAYKSIVETDVSRSYFNALNLTLNIARGVQA